MDNVKTGRLIFDARQSKGLTQKQLAELLNVSDKAVSKWERGAGFPDVSILIPLSDHLGLSLRELMSGEKSPVPVQDEPKELIGDVLELQMKKSRVKNKVAWAISITLLTLFVLFWAVMLILYFVNQYSSPKTAHFDDYSISLESCSVPMTGDIFCAVIAYYDSNYPVTSSETPCPVYEYGSADTDYLIVIEFIEDGIRYTVADQKNRILYIAYGDGSPTDYIPSADTISEITAIDFNEYTKDITHVDYGSFFYFLEDILSGGHTEDYRMP